MVNQFMQDVYDTLNGDMLPGCGVPGVENLFAPGTACEALYDEGYDAERRLEERLGIDGYDDDVELIIRKLTDIQLEMCRYMYYYGAKFGMVEQNSALGNFIRQRRVILLRSDI